eukprot:SAG31_NODE_16413_length_710_cov_0.972177_1_plen_213_part_10
MHCSRAHRLSSGEQTSTNLPTGWDGTGRKTVGPRLFVVGGGFRNGQNRADSVAHGHQNHLWPQSPHRATVPATSNTRTGNRKHPLRPASAAARLYKQSTSVCSAGQVGQVYVPLATACNPVARPGFRSLVQSAFEVKRRAASYHIGTSEGQMASSSDGDSPSSSVPFTSAWWYTKSGRLTSRAIDQSSRAQQYSLHGPPPAAAAAAHRQTSSK